MQLLLHINTKSVPSQILAAAYAFFPPYKFTDSGNGILETTIDASHDLTDEQWSVVASLEASVFLVLPTGTKPLALPPATATGMAAAPTSPPSSTTAPTS